MNLEKFNPKKVKELVLERKYNIMLTDSSVVCAELRSTGHSEKQGTYFFVQNNDTVHELPSITHIAPYTEFGYVAVGNGFALTKNGSKVFCENVYGVIDNEQYAQHYIINLNNNTNTFTPDAIHRNDIVECIDGHFYNGDKAIVTEVRKPKDAEDHGTVEVYMLDKKFFEHFTYTGWNQFLKVVEEYN